MFRFFGIKATWLIALPLLTHAQSLLELAEPPARLPATAPQQLVVAAGAPSPTPSDRDPDAFDAAASSAAAARLLPVSAVASASPAVPGTALTYPVPDDFWPALERLPLHGSGTVTLPNGSFRITHDNDFDYGPDGKTWVGYLDNNKNYRCILTAGDGTLVGTILTPGKRFSLQDGVFIDLESTRRLQFEDHVPTARQLGRVVAAAPKAIAAAASSAAAPSAAATVVDVLIFFEPSLAKGAGPTRIRHLAALTNQAYVDSKISLQVRVVAMRKLYWLAQDAALKADNDQLLDRLTRLVQSNQAYRSLRNRLGADLVTIIRPNRAAQNSCGLGYVGGAQGGPFSSDTGLAVVSDGLDELRTTSCDDYTFAHEIGHNLGSAHDYANAEYAGHFPYSYGETGADAVGGQWHTIMAYPQSAYAVIVPKFSSPALQCTVYPGAEVPCGSRTENNAKSIRRSAASVAAYLPTRQ